LPSHSLPDSPQATPPSPNATGEPLADAAAPQPDSPAPSSPGSPTAASKAKAASAPQPDETVRTSLVRKNTLEEYEEDYRPHIACFKFLDKGKFSKVPSYDYDPCLLTLAVYDEEARAYLILGYEDGRVAKVPVEQLLKYDDYREYARNTKSRLTFATIAGTDDAIICISRESKAKNRLMVRMDRLSALDDGTLNSTGERLYKEGIGEVVRYDVAPHDQLEGVEGLMDKDARSVGMPIATLSPEVKRRLEKWGIQ